ncbi:MAG: hypothetical protein Cons2KO_02150 [Congregibacter sp.]
MEVFSTSAQAILGSAVDVGIGIAGFSGIILALVPESFRKRQPLTLRWALQILVFTSLVIIGFSRLPFLIVEMGFEPMVWQVCSAVYVIYYPFITYFRFEQGFAAKRREQVAWQRRSVIVTNVTAAGLAAIWLLQIANVAYFAEAWPFLLFMVYYILFAFVHFANFLLVIISDQDQAGEA